MHKINSVCGNATVREAQHKFKTHILSDLEGE